MLKSATITDPRGSDATTDTLAPVHPGEVLSHDFLTPMGLSANALARQIGVPGNRISMIIAGKRGISGDTALRLAEAFGTTPEFWMNLQKGWELDVAREAIRLSNHA